MWGVGEETWGRVQGRTVGRLTVLNSTRRKQGSTLQRNLPTSSIWDLGIRVEEGEVVLVELLEEEEEV